MLANATTGSRIPDILGIIARAKGSTDAMATSKIVSEVGKSTVDSGAARFHERGILEYARTSVKLVMELLEGIREEVCSGMDVFDNIMNLDVTSETQRVTALSTFLLQVLERMALRLDGFYGKLARYSICHPEMEQNLARTRWNLLRRKIFDGSFFVLTQEVEFGITPPDSYPRHQDPIELDHVISQIQKSISRAPTPLHRPLDLTSMHVARERASTQNGVSEFESHENGVAMNRMSSFMTDDMNSIRRLSKMPKEAVSLEQVMSVSVWAWTWT